MANDLTFSYVSERDIDHLLVEELRASRPFLRVVLEAAVGLKQTRKLLDADEVPVDVNHSVSTAGTGAGETDIEIRVGRESDGRWSTVVLLENKVDAQFQPEQAERYALRASGKVESGEAAASATLLTAPADYLASASSAEIFDAVLSYEALRIWFLARALTPDAELARRFSHRAEVIEQAIEKSRRGYTYTPTPSAEASAFALAYWQLASAEYPQLDLVKPDPVRSAGSKWFYFGRRLQRDSRIPRPKFLHKTTGVERVDITLTQWAPRVAAVAQATTHLLPPEMEVKDAGSSLAFSVRVPPVDITKPFDQQIDAIRESLSTAVRLQEWWNKNLPELAAVLATLE